MNTIYQVKINQGTGGLSSLSLIEDEHNLNFIQGDHQWGEPYSNFEYRWELIECDVKGKQLKYQTKKLELMVTREYLENEIREKYTFTNRTDKKLLIEKGKVGIYTPLNDEYESARICMTNHVHGHVWCGGESSYVYGVKMNGEAPHFGMVVTEGYIDGYSVERDVTYSSNKRGDFILLPQTLELGVGECYTVAFNLFFFESYEDFIEKAISYGSFAEVKCEKYVVPVGDVVEVSVRTQEETKTFNYLVNQVGINRIEVVYHGKKTWANVWGVTSKNFIIEQRAKFIMEKQQWLEDGSMLDGAYVLYDNDTEKMFVGENNDSNAGRERIGMANFLASYYLYINDEKLKLQILGSLKKYDQFIHRELLDTEGTVYNQVGRDNTWHRLYNYPWVSTYLTLMHRVTGEIQYIKESLEVMKRYYINGGKQFYAINIPIVSLYTQLEESGLIEEAQVARKLFRAHADQIIEIGLNYPAHEVKYEQSIVAPSVLLLLETYQITGDKKYLLEGERQYKVLLQFCGRQPDYRLNQMPIRHWDIYWFGKAKLYGDTFPHHWSCINAAVMSRYAEIVGEPNKQIDANCILEGNLCQFTETGSAGCGYLLPYRVNNRPGDFLDCWANDQDWALYFYINYHKVRF